MGKTEFDPLAKQEGFEPGLEGRWRPGLRESALFDRNTIHEIHRMAREGIYDIRGFGAKRRVPPLRRPALSRRQRLALPARGLPRALRHRRHVSGTRFAKNPVELDIPITIAGMSFGALSAPAKEALGRGASAMGTSTTTGDGGMLPEEREHSSKLVYQMPALALRHEPRRPAPRRRGRGRGRPGREARRRGHAAGPEDQRPGRRDARPAEGRSTSAAPAGTPTGPAPTTCEIKIEELREITDWQKPDLRQDRRDPHVTSTSRWRSRRAPT